jgi:hypothetical protein
MSLSDTRILVSGCGMTFSNQELKTWPNILQLTGCTIIDVSGPAVSNQWVIIKTFLGLQQHPDIKTAIVQLTSLGKLDVEVDLERINFLVRPDPLRNFIIDKNLQIKSGEQIENAGIWPSSGSTHHESKKYWDKWLFSPTLEKEDLYCKLVLLHNYCQQHHIELHVYQGYDIQWTEQQIVGLRNVIKNINSSFYFEYVISPHFQKQDTQNSILCIEYQLEIAQIVSKDLTNGTEDKIKKLKLANEKSQQKQ